MKSIFFGLSRLAVLASAVMMCTAVYAGEIDSLVFRTNNEKVPASEGKTESLVVSKRYFPSAQSRPAERGRVGNRMSSSPAVPQPRRIPEKFWYLKAGIGGMYVDKDISPYLSAALGFQYQKVFAEVEVAGLQAEYKDSENRYWTSALLFNGGYSLIKEQIWQLSLIGRIGMLVQKADSEEYPGIYTERNCGFAAGGAIRGSLLPGKRLALHLETGYLHLPLMYAGKNSSRPGGCYICCAVSLLFDRLYGEH